MNILLVDVSQPLVRALAGLGHTVREARPPRGIAPLGHILKRLATGGFCPDMLLQQESLGPRLYLSGLDKAPCPSLFFAVDSHLNLHWQQWYARLFDGVLTPHLSLFAALPQGCRPPAVSRMAWFGQARQWRPHEARGRFMGLCARRTEHRPLREWFVELLSGRGLECVEGLQHEEMMRLYDDSRLAPNECIAWESNFRLLEAASAGCCVLSPDVGEDQDALLEPGREFLVWKDGLDLLDRVAWARMRPGLAEKIGRSAHERVNACHLPAHRARFLLDTTAALARNRLPEPYAGLALWLATAKQLRNNVLSLDPAGHAAKGLRLLEALPDRDATPQDMLPLVSHTQAQVLILLAQRPEGAAKALDMCRDLAATATGGEEAGAFRLETASAASALALREGDFNLARFFWLGWRERRLAPGPGAALTDRLRNMPATPPELCRRWASALRDEGRTAQVGFAFQPDNTEQRALPECALEYLHFASRFVAAGAEGDAERERLLDMERDMTTSPVHLTWHLNSLDALCRLQAGNWRLRLSYGLACIKACLVEEGVCVISEARRAARATGQERRFDALCRSLGCAVEKIS